MDTDEPIFLPKNRYERKKAVWRTFIELVETVLLSIFLFLMINIATSRILVESISMQPTLFERDMVLVNRLAYRFGEPHRKDVIVFMPPLSDAAEPYIKRVIGLPGDTVRIENGEVIINGMVMRESYLKAPPEYRGTWTVPEDHLFVLGDNRNSSSDSHYWGTVPIANVIGKAEFIYWPIAHLKNLNPASAAAAEKALP